MLRQKSVRWLQHASNSFGKCLDGNLQWQYIEHLHTAGSIWSDIAPFFFCSIPTEQRISLCKVQLRNFFIGWSVRRELLNQHELKHFVNVHALDLGFSIFDAKEVRGVPESRRARM